MSPEIHVVFLAAVPLATLALCIVGWKGIRRDRLVAAGMFGAFAWFYVGLS